MGLDSFPYSIFGRKERFLPLVEMTTGNYLWPCHFEEANATEKSFLHES